MGNWYWWVCAPGLPSHFFLISGRYLRDDESFGSLDSSAWVFLHQDDYTVNYHFWDVGGAQVTLRRRSWGPVFNLKLVTSAALAVGGEKGLWLHGGPKCSTAHRQGVRHSPCHPVGSPTPAFLWAPGGIRRDMRTSSRIRQLKGWRRGRHSFNQTSPSCHPPRIVLIIIT